MLSKRVILLVLAILKSIFSYTSREISHFVIKAKNLVPSAGSLGIIESEGNCLGLYGLGPCGPDTIWESVVNSSDDGMYHGSCAHVYLY